MPKKLFYLIRESIDILLSFTSLTIDRKEFFLTLFSQHYISVDYLQSEVI